MEKPDYPRDAFGGQPTRTKRDQIANIVPHKHGVDYMLKGAGDWISKKEVLAILDAPTAQPSGSMDEMWDDMRRAHPSAAPTDNTALVEAWKMGRDAAADRACHPGNEHDLGPYGSPMRAAWAKRQAILALNPPAALASREAEQANIRSPLQSQMSKMTDPRK